MEMFSKVKDKSYEDMISLKNATKVVISVVRNGFVIEYGKNTYVCKDYDELKDIVGFEISDYIERNRLSVQGIVNFKKIEYYVSEPKSIK